jgi:predicted NBD/HSP70 family sugar kinase
MKHKVGNSKFLKELNRVTVLDLIRHNKIISRSQIVKETGLTATAVSDITGFLLEKQYIEEIGTGESSGGRRPINLRLNPNACFVIGVDLAEDNIIAVVLNFAAEKIGEIQRHITLTLDVDEYVGLVNDLIVDLILKCNLKKEDILGIGLGLEDIEIKKKLSTSLDLPVFLEKDANATAMAENWLGFGRDCQNFICINLRTNIRSGIFINGEIYYGASRVAGEFGHISVEVDGPICDCGAYGCLQSLVATPAIIKRATKLIKQGRQSIVTDITPEIEQLDLRTLCEAAGKEDPLIKEIFMQTGMYLGIGVANVLNFLNPQKIILCGDIIYIQKYVLKELERVLNLKSLKKARKACEVCITELGQEATAIGAGIVVLKNFLRIE